MPAKPDVVLPLEIHGQQVFSTAGRVTAIERDVVMRDVEVNPPDFTQRRAQAYASKLQMVRDTDAGLRYLVPDPATPERRIVENGLTRRSLFGLAGAFYQRSSDYPLPLLGLQYFDFDLWGKEKQLSVFFGGVLLFANYTDPALFGTRLDLGVDAFGQAIPFSEQSYRGGEEVVGGAHQAPRRVRPGQRRACRSARTSRRRSGSSPSGTTFSATATRRRPSSRRSTR